MTADSLRRMASRAVIALATATIGCSDATGPNDGAFRVELSAAPGATLGWGPNWDGPLIACLIPIEMRALGRDQTVRWHGATLQFFQGASRDDAVDTVHISAPELASQWQIGELRSGDTHEFTLDVRARIPFEALLEIRYSAASRERRASVRVTCGPTPPASYAPPVVSPAILAGPTDLRPGDAVQISVAATSTYGLMRTVVSVSGPFERADSWLNFSTRTANHSISYVVPPDAMPDVPITVTVTAFDAAGQSQSHVLVTERRVVDTEAPVLHAATAFGGFEGWVAPGGGIGLNVNATDDLELLRAQVVVDIDADVDARVTLPYAATVSVPVTDGWSGLQAISAHVRDQTGKTSNTLAVPTSAIRFHPTATRQVQTAAMSGLLEHEPVYDAARERLYFPDHATLGRLDLTTMTRLPSIPLPLADGEGYHGDGDLSMSGDTLLLALPYASALAVVDLASSTPTVTRVNITAAPRSGGAAEAVAIKDVKVGADGSVFVLARDLNVDGDQLLAVSLATGIGQWIDLGPIADRFDYLAREPARDHLFLISRFCPSTMPVATRQLRACGFVMTDRLLTSRPHFSATSDRMLTGGYLRDFDLQGLPAIAPLQDAPYARAAFSLDDSILWIMESSLLTRLRVSDGVRLDRMGVGFAASTIHVSPRGDALYIISAFRNSVARVSLP